MAKNEKRSIYQNASAIIPYRLKLADGTFQHLTGYSITFKVKARTSDPDPGLWLGYADVRGNDDTWADFHIPRGSLSMPPKKYAACVEALNETSGDFQPDAFELEIMAHG